MSPYWLLLLLVLPLVVWIRQTQRPRLHLAGDMLLLSERLQEVVDETGRAFKGMEGRFMADMPVEEAIAAMQRHHASMKAVAERFAAAVYAHPRVQAHHRQVCALLDAQQSMSREVYETLMAFSQGHADDAALEDVIRRFGAVATPLGDQIQAIMVSMVEEGQQALTVAQAHAGKR